MPLRSLDVTTALHSVLSITSIACPSHPRQRQGRFNRTLDSTHALRAHYVALEGYGVFRVEGPQGLWAFTPRTDGDSPLGLAALVNQTNSFPHALRIVPTTMWSGHLWTPSSGSCLFRHYYRTLRQTCALLPTSTSLFAHTHPHLF